MFNLKYIEWNQKRIKSIIDHYGYQFMVHKKVLDLGCGHADISGALYRLGADITAVDARQEHLTIANKKFPGIKTIKADLDQKWPFPGKKFDVILDLGILCHLKNYEAHLRDVCSSTEHLILETAVCNSTDPNLSVAISENKAIYDLSVNGVGSRPSAAAIERILRDFGMEFIRIDSSKLNVGDEVYDWPANNSGNTSIHNRRFWFAKNKNVSQNIHIPVIQNVSISNNNLQPGILQKNNEIASPIATPTPTSIISPTYTNYSQNYYSISNDDIKNNSKRFSVIHRENWVAPNTFTDISGTILCSTLNSSLWFSKISPFFPNIKSHKISESLLKFNKTEGVADLVMCDIGSIRSGNRVFIEEWSDYSLNNIDIQNLQNSSIIFTPSLINAQDILKEIPNANVIRTCRPWPALDVAARQGLYFTYFEKNPELTKNLLDQWSSNWGKLVVVGSTSKLPEFATYFSDGDSYNNLISTIRGSQAIINLHKNNYYFSGVQELSKSFGVPIITNNMAQSESDLIVTIDTINYLNIEKSINKLSGKKIPNYDINYNTNFLYNKVKSILGK